MTDPQPIPLVDLKAQVRSLGEDLHLKIRELVEQCRFIGGETVTRFENEFARYVEVEHCIGVANGTDAIQLVLRALGIGPGDEVITVPSTFAATAEAIALVGATPRFVDVEPLTWTMDPEALSAAIGPLTKAVIPVHLYGCPARMDEILEVSSARGIPVIEDAAQAHGARWNGRSAGSMGLAGCFSFYPGKNLGAFGDAGAITTRDGRLADTLRRMKDHGRSSHTGHDILGTNSRLDALQAAVLSYKLPYLPSWTERRRELARELSARLEGLRVTRPSDAAMERSVFHLYPVLVASRDEILKKLHALGVQAGVHYPVPVHLQAAFRSALHPEGSLPNAERLARETLSLPLFPEMRPDQVDRVVAALAAALD